MSAYTYRARSRLTGQVIAGRVEARNRQEVIERLAEMGYCTLHLGRARSWRFGGRLREAALAPGARDRALLYRQMASMLRAGLTLSAVLASLEPHARPAVRRVLAGVRRLVLEGSQLHEALAAFPAVFPSVHVSLVRAGEISGRLEPVMERLAALQEGEVALAAKVRSAATYPALVVGVTFCVAVLMVLVVLPGFLSAFPEIRGALPAPTRVLLSLSGFLSARWHLLALALVALAMAAAAWLRTPAGRARRDRWILRLPVVGPIAEKLTLARITRTLATLVDSNLPLLDALGATAAVAGNGLYARALLDARMGVSQGEPLSEPLEMSGVFPPLVVQMVRAGEQTGHLEEMLDRAADFYDREVEEGVKRLTSTLEPLLVLAVGGLVAFIAASVFLPLFRMIASIQAGI